jgi:hypothetical protein
MITLLMFNALFSIVSFTNVRGDIDPADINYSWELDTFSAQISRIWEDTNFLMNETGSYDDTFNHSYGYAISEDEWIEQESVFTYRVNYSYYSNLTLTGDFTIDVDFDVYKVEISYGSTVNLIWIGFKNGTYSAEYVIDCISHNYKHENSFYKKTETTYKKYNITTMELLDSWDETIEDSGAWVTEPEPGDDNYTIYQTLDMEFSMPLIITFQVYETQNGEKVAWAEMISDFYVFDDKDGNSVYSIGETQEAQDMFHMTTSDEYCGMFMPWAHNITIHTDYWSPTHSFNDTHNYKFPADRAVAEFGDSIQFTPPQLTDSEVAWNIEYPEFPIYGIVQTDTAFFYTGSGMDYVDTSPGNFSYGFNYEITNMTADLDFTVNLPRLSDPDFFNAADNLSLAFPHYTYFLSSTEIEETINPALTIPSSMFQFDLNDTKVAEINMDSEDKKYYTLMDYPDLESNRSFEAIGSTVSKLISNELENNPSAPKNWFVDTIFSLEDIDLVKLDPQFDDAFSLYCIEMQNYPVWSGYKLIHDPTLTIYHGQQGSSGNPIVPDPPEDPPDDTPDDTPNDPPDDPVPAAISGYDLCLVAGLTGVITILIAKKKKLKKS